MSDRTFLVDTIKCQGCRACQVACKQWNGLPGEETDFFAGPEYTNPAKLSATTWNYVKFFPLDRRNPSRPVWTIMHTKCNHCVEANCERICPEHAISKVDGWTIIDQSRCIGCGACVNECVYNVPEVSDATHVNDMKQKIVIKDRSHKCNACLVNTREVPACVNTCPSYALSIGPRQAIIKKALQRLDEVKKEFPNASVYGLEEFGGLRVITILRDKPETFELPTGEKAKPIDLTRAEEIRDTYRFLSLFSFGLPSLKRAAYRIARSMSDGHSKVS